MHSLDNHMSTHTFHPNYLTHKPLLHHVDQHGQVLANKQLDPHAASFIMTSSQNETSKSCSPKYVNYQALPCLHYTNSTRLHPSVYTHAINSKGIDDNMRFNSCSYGSVKLNKTDTDMGFTTINIQEEQRRANSYIIMEEEILAQSLGPNNIYASNIKKIDDDNMSFTSCSYGVLKVKEDDSNMGFNSSNIKEQKERENYNIEKEDLLSSRAGSFDVRPTKQDANKDGNILNFSSLSKPKLEVSRESVNANPIRASICKASKSPRNKKTHQKQIICVPLASESQNKSAGECLHRDSWAWRKYGQKPIKGSPYPRGYYRCSSCKGCTARKQVERSRSDPGMLTITYTSGHNHPWQANQKNRRKLEAAVHENSYSSDPHENFNSIHGSMQHGDKIHVKTSATDSPYNSMLEGNSPCIRGKYDIGNLQDEEPQNELDYFGLLEELPGNSSLTMIESTKSPSSEQHEDPITIVHSNVVDPFNLFNWSSNIGLNYYSAT